MCVRNFVFILYGRVFALPFFVYSRDLYRIWVKNLIILYPFFVFINLLCSFA